MEITKKNFSDQINNITEDLKQSSFVGFDAEFTAILSGECFKHRLFDTNEERYNRLTTEVSKMIMTQVGLTMFRYKRDQEAYEATTYTFHLCPQAFGDVDQSFIFQASTLKFLCKHNFDFNKFTYEGLPYLSKVEEAKVRQHLKDKTLFNNLTRMLDMDEERKIQLQYSEVSKWLSTGEEDKMYLDSENHVLRYIIHYEVRMRYPDVLTTDSFGDSKKILIYRDKHVEGANSTPLETLEENLINHLLGFSQIIYLLEAYQKPIVGHNIYLDTVLLHSQFIGPLPNDYLTFKKNINKTFPYIYDTKHVSHEMSRILSYQETWKSNALQDLYEFFSEGKCKKLQNGVNLIKLTKPFNKKQTYHEAGWDSFCSGYCFIRLGHWAACLVRGQFRLVTPTEKLAALSPYCNRVNVIRGAIPYMDLVGNDPPRHRPDLLQITTLKERVINVGKVASLLANFGSIDIKPFGRRTALIAANSQNIVDRIIKKFNDSNEYSISRYSGSRFSSAGRMALWSGAFVTGSLFLLLIHRKVKSVS